jgi:alpha-galactosidase-like protein
MVTAILGLLVSAPAAAADVLTAEVDAESGDQAVAGRDITGLSVRYDTAGRISATVSLRGAPSAGDPTLVIVHMGTISGTTCAPPAAVVGTPLAAAEPAVWAFDGGEGPATKAINASTVALEAAAPALANLAQRCVWAQTTDGVARLDETSGWGELAPAPPPDPGPAPPAPQPQPQPSPPSSPPVQPEPKRVAKLAVAGLTKTVKRNRATRLKLRVSNTGSAPARDVRLALGRARGATAKPRTARWRRLAAGKSVTATVRVKLTRRARRTTRIAVRVRARGNVRATGAIKLAIAGKKRKPARPPAVKGALVGRHFWGFRSRPDYAWENHGVYFVDDRWAYEGLPKGGLPRCTSVTEELDDKGKPIGDGCRRYTYDRVSGALTVGDLTGTYKDGKLTLDEIEMRELTTPKPGTRYELKLDHRGFSGFCGLITGCTTWQETLGLLPDGQFVRTSRTVSTIGGSGTPFVGLINYPPSERGTYEIQSRGRIRLAFADGTIRVETIGIQRNEQGKPDPVNTGLLLDDTNFYPEDD